MNLAEKIKDDYRKADKRKLAAAAAVGFATDFLIFRVFDELGTCEY